MIPERILNAALLLGLILVPLMAHVGDEPFTITLAP